MKILLTGGAGYIGSHTCVELLAAGHSGVWDDLLHRFEARVLEAALRPLRRAVPLLLTPRRRTAEDSPGTP